MFRTTDPITSVMAAARVAPTLKKKQQIVLDAFEEHGPMTDEELSARLSHLKWGDSTARSRRCELTRMGLIEKDPCLPRPTRTESDATVWRLVEVTPQFQQ